MATLDCGHKFHYKCVGKWSRKKNSCPICRAKIFDDEDFQSESDTESDSNDEDAIHITDLEATWNPPNNNNLNHDSDSNEEHLIVNNLMEYYSSLDRFYNDIQNFEDVTDTVLRRIQNTNVIVNITCVDCNKNLKNCEACGDFTCGCSNDHNHYNGKNPFYNENVQDLKVTCKKCFERRETMLSTYIFDNFANIHDIISNISTNEFLTEHFKNYFMNYNLLQFNTEMTIDDILENNIARNFINNNDPNAFLNGEITCFNDFHNVFHVIG